MWPLDACATCHCAGNRVSFLKQWGRVSLISKTKKRQIRSAPWFKRHQNMAYQSLQGSSTGKDNFLAELVLQRIRRKLAVFRQAERTFPEPISASPLCLIVTRTRCKCLSSQHREVPLPPFGLLLLSDLRKPFEDYSLPSCRGGGYRSSRRSQKQRKQEESQSRSLQQAAASGAKELKGEPDLLLGEVANPSPGGQRTPRAAGTGAKPGNRKTIFLSPFLVL